MSEVDGNIKKGNHKNTRVKDCDQESNEMKAKRE